MKRTLCVILVFMLLFLSSCSVEKKDEVTTDVEYKSSEYCIGNNVYVTEVNSYTGAYYEDGSNDIVENIMSVVIENRSEYNYQIFDFNLVIGGETYYFESTTLQSNSKMIVLDKNRKVYAQSDVISSGEVVSVGEFPYTFSLFSDVFFIETDNSSIKITDITNDIHNNVYVYYKNINSDGVYLGGITYRTGFQTLEPGLTQQSVVESFSKDYSKVVFVTYDEML